MVPRPDMHTLSVEASLDEVMRAFATTQRSRIPVYRGTEDHILGLCILRICSGFCWTANATSTSDKVAPPFDLRRVLREVLIVPETKPASELMLELRSHHVGLAMVVDEFGSILGLVTLEDVLEQMVGEIHDEFDVVERAAHAGGWRGGIRCGAERSGPGSAIQYYDSRRSGVRDSWGIRTGSIGIYTQGRRKFRFRQFAIHRGGDGRQTGRASEDSNAASDQ